MSTTSVLTIDENNNEVIHRGLPFRRILFFIGGVALVAGFAFLGVAAYGRPGSPGGASDPEQVVPSRLTRSAPSNTVLSVEQIRSLAREMGSIPPSDLAELEKQGDICYTQGCLDAAVSLLNSINFTVNPCDDFYQYTCGRWLSTNQIPPASSRWSQFNFLRDEVNNITQGILTAPKDVNDAKPINQVKDLYAGCVDTAKLEATGLFPLRNILKGFGDWPLLLSGTWDETAFDWVKTVGDIRRRFLDTVILTVYVDQDIRSADENIIYIDQPSLVLPRDMLINEGGIYDIPVAAYKQFVIDVANELARADSNTPTPDPVALRASVDAMVAFEAQIAAITSKDTDRSDYDRMYNNFTLDKYQQIIDSLLPKLNIKTILDAVFATSGISIGSTEKIIVSEVDYVVKLTELMKTTPASTVANYMNFRIASGLAGQTVQAMRDHAFKFNRVLTGAQQPPTREKSCADGANNGFGMAIGVKYIEQTFDDKAKAEVNRLVEDLRVAFKELLTTADWMDSTTEALAQVKANKMKSFMAYPDWLSDKAEVEKYFAGLEILEGNHFVNIERLSHWSGDKTWKQLRSPVDREFWLVYPGVVNAFYAPTYNSISFPAGILQAPFFKSGYPSFLNYGGIGVVIGHEITHGFDNSGRQFDAIGNAVDWWTPVTSDNYKAKAKCIENQYSQFSVIVEGSELKVDGLLTLGENIADNGGVREAYLAYKKFVEDNGVEKRLPGLEQFDPEQLFFMGVANIWCENITPAGLRNQLITDPHSPARFRVIGPLRNNEDFSTKWNCPVGSGMNPNPADRCILW